MIPARGPQTTLKETPGSPPVIWCYALLCYAWLCFVHAQVSIVRGTDQITLGSNEQGIVTLCSNDCGMHGA